MVPCAALDQRAPAGLRRHLVVGHVAEVDERADARVAGRVDDRWWCCCRRCRPRSPGKPAPSPRTPCRWSAAAHRRPRGAGRARGRSGSPRAAGASPSSCAPPDGRASGAHGVGGVADARRVLPTVTASMAVPATAREPPVPGSGRPWTRPSRNTTGASYVPPPGAGSALEPTTSPEAPDIAMLCRPPARVPRSRGLQAPAQTTACIPAGPWASPTGRPAPSKPRTWPVGASQPQRRSPAPPSTGRADRPATETPPTVPSRGDRGSVRALSPGTAGAPAGARSRRPYAARSSSSALGPSAWSSSATSAPTTRPRSSMASGIATSPGRTGIRCTVPAAHHQPTSCWRAGTKPVPTTTPLVHPGGHRRIEADAQPDRTGLAPEHRPAWPVRSWTIPTQRPFRWRPRRCRRGRPAWAAGRGAAGRRHARGPRVGPGSGQAAAVPTMTDAQATAVPTTTSRLRARPC